MEIIRNDGGIPLRSSNNKGDPIYSDYQDLIWFQGTGKGVADIHGTDYQIAQRFWMNFAVDFKILSEAGTEVSFKMVVDDGCVFIIDDKEVLFLAGPSEKKELTTSLQLQPGLHTLKLRYVQDFGNMYMQAFYRFSNQEEWNIVGENTKLLTYQKPMITRFLIQEEVERQKVYFPPGIPNTKSSSTQQKIFFPATK